MAKKDKFHGTKQREEDKTISQRGVSIQNEAIKTSMRLSDIEVTREDVINEFAPKYQKANQIIEHYRIPEKRVKRIMEKVFFGPLLPDAMIPLKKNDEAEAALYMAFRDLQDIIVVGTEVIFNEMRASEQARKEAAAQESNTNNGNKTT